MPRPYRSHKEPACEACRRRKVRCDVDDDDAKCKRCRRLGHICHFTTIARSTPASPATSRASETRREGGSSVNHTPSHGQSQSAGQQDATATRRPPSRSSANGPRAVCTPRDTNAALLVGPAVAEDVRILENYLDTHGPLQHDRVTPYQTTLSTGEEAVVYVTVPRSRTDLQVAQDPGQVQLEAMRRILGTSQDELLDIFTKHVHPHFPIVDLQAFRELEPNGAIPNTLLCYIYASALHMWDKSPVLAQRSPPDSAHLTLLAGAALQSDFMAPTNSTIAAAVLDLLLRPVRPATASILTIGKLVAFAHSIGLHRDPTQWRCSQQEKSLRKRLWWSIVIHDRWGSYAYGTPPHISCERYDVAVLDPADWAPIQHDPSNRQMAVSCTQFCHLTQNLSELLDLVHTLKTRWEDVPRTLRRIECALDIREADLLRLCKLDPYIGPPSGHCSLWLCFLSVRVLVQRLYLRAATIQTALPADSEKAYRTMTLRESAIAVVDFVDSLSHEHFIEYWCSYCAHFLVSTTIMLLRCMIETNDSDALHRCRMKLVLFQKNLREARANSGWDIADLCLERCSDAIDRVTDTSHWSIRYRTGTSNRPGDAPLLEQDFDLLDVDWLAQSISGLDTLLPAESLEMIWDRI